MDKRKDNGGARGGAGRKPKATEQELIEKLTPLEESAFKALQAGLKDGQNWAVKLFFEYKFGKAKEYKEIDIVDNNITVSIVKWFITAMGYDFVPIQNETLN